MLPAMFDVGSDQLRMARRPLAALDFEIKGQNFLRIGIELAEGDVRDIEPALAVAAELGPTPALRCMFNLSRSPMRHRSESPVCLVGAGLLHHKKGDTAIARENLYLNYGLLDLATILHEAG